MSILTHICKVFKSHQENGFEIPFFLRERKISSLDVQELRELFDTNNILYFHELTQDMLKEYLKNSYSNAIYTIKILGLYGVVFHSEKLKQYSLPVPSDIKILKFTRTNEEIVVADIQIPARVKLQRFLYDMKLFSSYVLDGIRQDVLLSWLGMSLDELRELLNIEYYETLDDIYKETHPENINSNDQIQYSLFETGTLTESSSTFCQENREIDIRFLNLSVRSYNALKNNRINTLNDLLKLDETHLIKIPSIGKKSLNEILQKQEECRKKYPESIKNIIKETHVDIKKVPYSIAKINLLEADLSARVHNILRENNLIYLEDILKISSSSLLRLKNMGRKSYNELLCFLKKYNLSFDEEFEIDDKNNYSNGEIELINQLQNISFDTLYSSIHSFEEKYCDGSRKYSVYHERIKNKRKSTLQKLGDQFDLTRERIRQIEKSLLRKLGFIIKHHKSTFHMLFNKYGDVLSYNDIPELKILDGYFDLLKNTINSECNDYFYIDTDLCIISKLDTDLDEIVISESEKTTYSLEEIKSELYNKLKKLVFSGNKDTDLNFDKVLHIFVDFYKNENFVYDKSTSLYIIKGKDRNRLLEAFKTCYPHGAMLHQESNIIYENLLKNCDALDVSTPRSLILRLINCPDKIILTNNGFYQHIDTLDVNNEAILFALEKCKEKLAVEQQPFLISVIFNKYQDYFQKNGIFSEYLLFSLLKRQNDPSLNFRRLTVCSPEDESVSVLDSFEGYFRQYNGIISTEDVEQHFYSLGWNDLRISNYLGISKNVYKISNGYFHKNNVSCNLEKLKLIIDKIKIKLEECGYVSLDVIKDKNFVDWIDVFEHEDLDAKSMASIIKAFYPEYPYEISSTGLISIENKLKPYEALYQWINQKCYANHFVTTAQITAFCEENKFHKYNTKNQIKSRVLEVAEDCWVTYDYVGMTPLLEDKILNILEEDFRSSMKPYMSFKDILSHTELPTLINGDWSEYLLRSLLINRGLQSIFHLVIINPFQSQIMSFDQVVAFEISNYTKTWYMEISKLEKLLRRNGILEKNETFAHRGLLNEVFYENSSIELRDQNKNVCIKTEYRKLFNDGI